MDKGKMLEEIQEKTEEIKGRAEELHKVIEETIAQKKQQHQEARYIELGAGDSQDKKTVIIKDDMVWFSEEAEAEVPMRSECGKPLRSIRMS